MAAGAASAIDGVADIVPYAPEMLLPLVDLWRASFEHGVGIVDPHPIEAQRRYFSDRVLPQFDVAVAMLGDEIVGFVAANRESIAQLHVRVGRHRRGIGTSLLDLAKARSAGSLWLYTFARNSIARRFYERHGFVAIEQGFEATWQLEDVKYRWLRPAA
jgi:ribosomal protein S18 acetylase RimI-like enzyme